MKKFSELSKMIERIPERSKRLEAEREKVLAENNKIKLPAEDYDDLIALLDSIDEHDFPYLRSVFVRGDANQSFIQKILDEQYADFKECNGNDDCPWCYNQIM